MKTIEKLGLITAIAGFTLFSCDDDDNKNTVVNESKIETEMTVDNEYDSKKHNESDTAKSKAVITKSYAMKDGNKISYDQDDRGVITVMDWDDYNTLSYELYDISTTDFETANIRMASLEKRIANLANSIPAWLKTEEVLEDVDDIQKEYKELIAEKDASEKERKENYEELSEQFDDLREELIETMEKYLKVHKDAIEEFNEEIKDGNWEDVREEYYEEMKKLKKIK